MNGQLALVHELVRRYQETGLQDVTLVTYPGARHEVSHEIDRDEVVAGVLGWVADVLAR